MSNIPTNYGFINFNPTTFTTNSNSNVFITGSITMPIPYDDRYIIKPGATNLISNDQLIELQECQRDIRNFAKFIKITHPVSGLSLLQPRNYQMGLLNRYQRNNFNIVKSTRQSGVSTMNAIYVLWYAFFNPNKTIVICAGNLEYGKHQIDIIKEMYIQLPPNLKLGLIELNKDKITFENNSTIKIVQPNPDQLRGYAISLLVWDNCAFYPDYAAREMFRNVIPSIQCSGGKFIMNSCNHRSSGVFTLFDEIWYDANENESIFKPFNIRCHQVPGRDEKWEDKMRESLGNVRFNSEYNI
jgi:hypothetical protein